MKARILIFAALLAWPQVRNRDPEEPIRLPDGRSQQEAILKEDHKRSLKDAEELARLSADLRAELEKNDRHVLALSTLKKLDEIEKIAKRIRSRYKRF